MSIRRLLVSAVFGTGFIMLGSYASAHHAAAGMGDAPQPEEIGCVQANEPVLEPQPLPCLDLVGHGTKAGIPDQVEMGRHGFSANGEAT